MGKFELRKKFSLKKEETKRFTLKKESSSGGFSLPTKRFSLKKNNSTEKKRFDLRKIDWEESIRFITNSVCYNHDESSNSWFYVSESRKERLITRLEDQDFNIISIKIVKNDLIITEKGLKRGEIFKSIYSQNDYIRRYYEKSN